MKRFLFTATAIFLLAGCSTAYGPMGFTGGVQAVQITSDTYQIEARGNANTSPAAIQQFVLLKAAETALENGYEGFDLIGAQNASTSGSIVHPGMSQAYSNGAGGYYGFGAPSYVNHVTKPAVIVAVRMIRNANSASFNAKEIANNLGPVLKANATHPKPKIQASPSSQ